MTQDGSLMRAVRRHRGSCFLARHDRRSLRGHSDARRGRPRRRGHEYVLRGGPVQNALTLPGTVPPTRRAQRRLGGEDPSGETEPCARSAARSQPLWRDRPSITPATARRGANVLPTPDITRWQLRGGGSQPDVAGSGPRPLLRSSPLLSRRCTTRHRLVGPTPRSLPASGTVIAGRARTSSTSRRQR